MIFCRRTLHLCDRYPFSFLVKSVSAVSGRDFMVVKLLLYFFCVCFAVFCLFFFCGFDLFLFCFVFCFLLCLVICMLLFLFSVSVKVLIAVNRLGVI